MTEPLSKITPKDALAIAAGVGATVASYEVLSRSKYLLEHLGGKGSLFGAVKTSMVDPVLKSQRATIAPGSLPYQLGQIIGGWFGGR